ncbi:hypothetical protein AAHA92_06144 [Salvia divinorum]|uniref:Uncharacterized protein n=1 Tax=Salvia divinorum TaxID=28513 RepID=A0ABD1I5L6_SALDI
MSDGKNVSLPKLGLSDEELSSTTGELSEAVLELAPAALELGSPRRELGTAYGKLGSPSKKLGTGLELAPASRELRPTAEELGLGPSFGVPLGLTDVWGIAIIDVPEDAVVSNMQSTREFWSRFADRQVSISQCFPKDGVFLFKSA